MQVPTNICQKMVLGTKFYSMHNNSLSEIFVKFCSDYSFTVLAIVRQTCDYDSARKLEPQKQKKNANSELQVQKGMDIRAEEHSALDG